MRKRGPDDQAFVDHLYFTSRTDLQQVSTDALFVEQLIRQQQRVQILGIQHNFPSSQEWIVLDREKPIGRMVIETGAMDVRLIDLAFLPEAQGQGAGKASIRRLQAFAREKGLDISLAVNKSNAVAMGLYCSLGFVLHSSDAVFDQMHWGHAVSG